VTTNAEARQQILDSLGKATDRIGAALAATGDAYELLDDTTADSLEERLFRPVQGAYGRARRAHSEFAARHGLPGRAFEPALHGRPSHGTKGFVEMAVEALHEADETLSSLQDSMLPVEFGDQQLRADLSEVRRLLGPLPASAREFVRTLGR
jgi:hypothetical protein